MVRTICFCLLITVSIFSQEYKTKFPLLIKTQHGAVEIESVVPVSGNSFLGLPHGSFARAYIDSVYFILLEGDSVYASVINAGRFTSVNTGYIETSLPETVAINTILPFGESSIGLKSSPVANLFSRAVSALELNISGSIRFKHNYRNKFIDYYSNNDADTIPMYKPFGFVTPNPADTNEIGHRRAFAKVFYFNESLYFLQETGSHSIEFENRKIELYRSGNFGITWDTLSVTDLTADSDSTTIHHTTMFYDADDNEIYLFARAYEWGKDTTYYNNRATRQDTIRYKRKMLYFKSSDGGDTWSSALNFNSSFLHEFSDNSLNNNTVNGKVFIPHGTNDSLVIVEFDFASDQISNTHIIELDDSVTINETDLFALNDSVFFFISRMNNQSGINGAVSGYLDKSFALIKIKIETGTHPNYPNLTKIDDTIYYKVNTGHNYGTAAGDSIKWEKLNKNFTKGFISRTNTQQLPRCGLLQPHLGEDVVFKHYGSGNMAYIPGKDFIAESAYFSEQDLAGEGTYGGEGWLILHKKSRNYSLTAGTETNAPGMSGYAVFPGSVIPGITASKEFTFYAPGIMEGDIIETGWIGSNPPDAGISAFASEENRITVHTSKPVNGKSFWWRKLKY